VYLAESNHSVAYSISPKPRLVAKKGNDYNTVYDLSPGLWLFQNGKIQQLVWPPVTGTKP
jgi:hypothetical protein